MVALRQANGFRRLGSNWLPIQARPDDRVPRQTTDPGRLSRDGTTLCRDETALTRTIRRAPANRFGTVVAEERSRPRIDDRCVGTGRDHVNESLNKHEAETATAGASGAGTSRTANASGRKLWAVFTIVEPQGTSKAIWRRIGSAFANKDGSFRLLLDALPVNGTLHMREAEVESAAHAERV